MKGLRLMLLAGLIFGLASVPPTSVEAQTGGGWVGEYFNNPTLSGTPLLTRADSAIDFIWDTAAPSPFLPVDHFSARWSQVASFQSGVYRFTARSDDGVRIFLDNTLILDAWSDHPPDPPVSAGVSVSAGQHAVRVEYYENSGAALIQVSWSLVSGQVGSGTPWFAEYFNNAGLAGAPVFQQTEYAIDADWGYNAPVPGLVPPDDFGVRWTGSPYFSGGTYTFTIHADDGVRLWIDNLIVIDAWFDSGFTPAYQVTITLGTGSHAVRVEYYDRVEVAAIRVEWALSGGLPIPTLTPLPVLSNTGIWEAQYFNNPDLAGNPVYGNQLTAQGLDLNWGNGSPGAAVTPDGFSARFAQQAAFTGGPVRFVIRADDGVRVGLDGTLILDQWHVSSGLYYFVDVSPLAAGVHLLTVEYYEDTSLASLRLYWLYPQPAGPSVPVNFQVNTTLLNVRSGPGVGYPILGRAPQGQVFAVTGQNATDPRWVRLNFDGYAGWVNTAWGSLSGDQRLIPTVPGT